VEHGKRYSGFLVRLRQARIDAGLSQVQVSESLGKHQSFLSKCETGERRVDVIELQELAKLYRKDISYFLGK
jgi:transcriptional regulator with XRE-family HTH domain